MAAMLKQSESAKVGVTFGLWRRSTGLTNDKRLPTYLKAKDRNGPSGGKYAHNYSECCLPPACLAPLSRVKTRFDVCVWTLSVMSRFTA